jgi:hypothetical protein
MSDSGIIQTTGEEHVELLLGGAYPADTVPLICVLSGSRAYGLGAEDSDYDYLGLHLMDTQECLQHPRFRRAEQVIRVAFDLNLEEVVPGTVKSHLSLDSFEAWKFIDIYLKGAPAAHELLFMPAVYQEATTDEFLSLCREGLTNRLGSAARGIALHGWRQQRTSRKKTLMAYYRLLQAFHFLRDEEFEWTIDGLLALDDVIEFIPTGVRLFTEQMLPQVKNLPLSASEVEEVSRELDILVRLVDRAMITTHLPDQVPSEILGRILECLQSARAQWI